MAYDDDEFGDNDDPPFPDESDLTDLGDDPDDDSAELVFCPWCRAEIYEEAVRCPHCGKYLSREDAPPQISAWILIGAILCLLAIALVWMR